MFVETLIFLGVAFLFLYFGYLKNDYTTLMLASMAFVLTGLDLVLEVKPLGMLIIFFGVYLGIRTGLELIKKEGNILWQKRKKEKNLSR